MRRLLLVPLLLGPVPAGAQVEHDLQSWTRIGVRAPLGTGWSVQADVQSRIADDLTRLSELNARLLVERELSARWALTVGYHRASDPIDDARTRTEHRLIEQVTWSAPHWGTAEPQLRARLEQRWRSDGHDRQDRLRLLARLALPVRRASRIKLIAYEETFWALNAVDWRPRAGFDQQRLFAGVQFPVGKVQVDTGYLNQISDRKGPGADVAHIAALTLTYRL